MKIKLAAFLGLLLLVLLQSTLFSRLKILGAGPDPVLILVVGISLTLDLKWALLFSFAAGALKDSLGITAMGWDTLLLPLLGLAANRLSKQMLIEADYVKAAVVFIAALAHNLIIPVLLAITGVPVSLGISSRVILISAIYTVSLFLLFSRLCRLSGIKLRF